MDPIKWFQNQVGWKGTGGAATGTSIPKGSALVPTQQIQQIRTNLKVPGGAVPGGGIGIYGARGMNGGIIDKPIDAITEGATTGAKVILNHPNPHGKTRVRNHNGVSYNIGTPEGARGYKEALAKDGLTPDMATDNTVSTGSSAHKGGNLPPSAATPGEGPKGNEVGSDADPESPGLQGPGALSTGTGGGEERLAPEGLTQYGQTLGGLNSFNKGFLGEGYDLTDIQSTYQSEALPATLAGVTQLEKPLVEGASPTQKPDVSDPFQPNPQPQGYFPEGSQPFASTDKYTPYSTGGNPENPQDGSSSEPDRVERIRQVAFEPRGARQKEVASRKAVRGNFGGDEPDDSTLVSPMYANKERNKIRDTFLNYEGSSVKAAVAANAVAGFGKDSNANPRFNYGGELLNAKEGMEYKAKDAAMRGLDPTEFLDIPSATPKEDAPSTPDLSKTDVTSSAFTTAEPEAQAFFKKELDKIKAIK